MITKKQALMLGANMAGVKWVSNGHWIARCDDIPPGLAPLKSSTGGAAADFFTGPLVDLAMDSIQEPHVLAGPEIKTSCDACDGSGEVECPHCEYENPCRKCNGKGAFTVCDPPASGGQRYYRRPDGWRVLCNDLWATVLLGGQVKQAANDPLGPLLAFEEDGQPSAAVMPLKE
ncbi:MAG: hypothetical protein V1755_14130 [Chloroflexota bacterium]